jgi:hypothetical protein
VKPESAIGGMPSKIERTGKKRIFELSVDGNDLTKVKNKIYLI